MKHVNQIYESLNVSNNEDADMDASILLHLKYEDDEIEKIYS